MQSAVSRRAFANAFSRYALDSQPTEESAILNETELAICRTVGVDPADFLACRDADRQRAISEARLTESERAVCRATGVDVKAFLAARDA
jgi:hypothetical protein